ncbi:MAG: nucleoside deaminase [Bacilli bacterium]|nr:nucleoside deaminase [Bacilli bacterium]
MREAIEEARQGIHSGHGGPFGAVIVKDGKIIGRGHNQVVANNDPTCHGEVQAIRDACSKLGTFDLSGCEIYTTGEPCPMCLGAILWANIDKVYYGCNVYDTENIGFRDDAFYKRFSSRNEFCQVLDREECLKLYEEYNAIEGKTHY